MRSAHRNCSVTLREMPPKYDWSILTFIYVQWELFPVWYLGFLLRPYAATGRKSNVSLADLMYNVAFSLGSLWRVSLFGSFYFTVCKNRYTHSLIIPQYSVGSSAVKRAKLDGSLFKFFVEQFGNPSNTSSSESLRLNLSFLKVFNRSSS